MATVAFARSKKKVHAFEIDRVWIDKEAANHPQTFRILNKLKDVEVDTVEDRRFLKRQLDLPSAKRQLFLTKHLGQTFKACQGIGVGHLCCNYHTIDLISGCPMDCSYCILQSYLSNNPITTINVNIETVLSEVDAFLSAHQTKLFRIGTGELSDSLALDHITEFSSLLIPFFALKKNAIFELKTKTSFVDHLLDLKHKGRTVIAWSLNIPSIIEFEERGTATLDERLYAAQKVITAGYNVAFHFDPIIINKDGDVEEYLSLIDKVFASIEPRRIAWISLGMLRYPQNLETIATKRFAGTKIFTGEFIPSGNKMRYLRFIREKTYKPLWEKLKTKLPSNKLYLCMETDTVWNKIDPDITSSPCIEKRLCNTEMIPFDFRGNL